MSLYDENLLFADPSHQRGMRQKREASRRVFHTLHLDGREIQQSLANALRFLGVGLTFLGKLNWGVGLSGGDDGEGHRAKFWRQTAGLRVEAHVVVRSEERRVGKECRSR